MGGCAVASVVLVVMVLDGRKDLVRGGCFFLSWFAGGVVRLCDVDVMV